MICSVTRLEVMRTFSNLGLVNNTGMESSAALFYFTSFLFEKIPNFESLFHTNYAHPSIHPCQGGGGGFQPGIWIFKNKLKGQVGNLQYSAFTQAGGQASKHFLFYFFMADRSCEEEHRVSGWNVDTDIVE